MAMTMLGRKPSRVLHIDINNVKVKTKAPENFKAPGGAVPPCIIDKDNTIIKGANIYHYLKSLGRISIACIRVSDESQIADVVKYGDLWDTVEKKVESVEKVVEEPVKRRRKTKYE